MTRFSFALAVTTSDTDARPAPVTDSERGGLLDVLSQVADPRDSRGVRYPLAALLAVGSLDGILFIADALHTQTGHAHERAPDVAEPSRLCSADGVDMAGNAAPEVPGAPKRHGAV